MQVSVRFGNPNDAQTLVQWHRALYGQEFQLDEVLFGRYVEESLSQFNPTTDRIWIAEVDGQAAGCVGIVRVDKDAAQLRWFLVKSTYRGHRVGRLLIDEALQFCRDEGYHTVVLWTLSILSAARHLYERAGFEMVETIEHDVWGRQLIEERWDKQL